MGRAKSLGKSGRRDILAALAALVFLAMLTFGKPVFALEKCGALGAVNFQESYKMNKCAAARMRANVFAKNPKDDAVASKIDICPLLKKIPVIGFILCPFKEVAQQMHKNTIPYAIQITAEPQPEVNEISSESKNEVLGWRDSLQSFILRLIRKFSGQEKRGFLQEYRPASFKQVQGSEKEKIVKSFNQAKSMLLPAALQGGDKGPGVSLPPELAPSPAPPTPKFPGGGGGEKLWYTIDYRNPDISVSPQRRVQITSLVKKYWPDSLIDKNWQKAYRAAVRNSWNPAFVIALWIEESGASGVSAWDLGCRYGKDGRELPKLDLDKQLECLFAKNYAEPGNFEKFMCKYSEGHYPCVFEINPNFPKNLQIWYERLVGE